MCIFFFSLAQIKSAKLKKIEKDHQVHLEQLAELEDPVNRLEVMCSMHLCTCTCICRANYNSLTPDIICQVNISECQVKFC